MGMMLRKFSKHVVAVVALAGLTAVATDSPAASSDLGMLTRLLAPANLMMMVGNVCALHDPAFLAETAGKRGNIHFYAHEVKDEVSQGMSNDEVLLVLRQAADIAKAGALKSIRTLPADTPEIELFALKAWCDTIVKSLVQQYVLTHDVRHAEFELLVARAKAQATPD
jgi:hypothetical protein